MEKNSRRKKQQIQALFFLFSMVVTIFLINAFHSDFKRHRLRLSNRKFFKNNIIVQKIIYHDFDHDGFSEHIVYKHDTATKQDGIKFYTSNGGLVDQWTSNEPLFKNAIFFNDFDGDHYDEIYFFTMGKDSLFLYSFDPRQQNKFIIFRKLIVTVPRPNPNPRKIWDISKPNVIFYDSDHDHKKEMYISFSSGFSLYPRGIIKFDLNSQKIVAHSPRGTMAIQKPILVDLNNDRIPEILLSESGAPANSHDDNELYSDQHPWLVALDLNLNFFFKPIRFPYPFSSIKAEIWKPKKEKYLAVLYDYHGTYAFKPTLYLYSTDGQLLKQKKLSSKYNWRIYTMPKNDYSHLYLINDAETIYEIDNRFNKIQLKISENPLFNVLKEIDLNNDGESELIGLGKRGLGISENNFSETIYLKEIKINSPFVYSIKYNGLNQKPTLVVQTENYLDFYKFELNPWHHLQYPLAFLMLLLFYLSFNFIFELGQRTIYEREMKRELGHFFQKGLLMLDAKGRTRSVNAKFEQILKLNRHLQPKTHFKAGLEERDEIANWIDVLIKKQALLEKTLSIKSGDQSFSVKFQGIVLRGLWNLPVGYLILLDSNEYKFENEQLRVWVQTVQKLAHGIKAPLSSIQLGVQTLQMKLLQNSAKETSNLATDFQLLNSELQRVRDLTKQFLRFTSFEKPNLSKVALVELINKSLQKFQNFFNERLQIKVELDPSLRYIIVDPLLMEMVMQILLENAIEAMSGQGLILIVANLMQSPKDKFKNFVEIEICDNGPGIPKENIDKIFDPFFTTKPIGTGLGLAIAKNIIDAHQGMIAISSREGFSTVVRILLPLDETLNASDEELA